MDGGPHISSYDSLRGGDGPYVTGGFVSLRAGGGCLNRSEEQWLALSLINVYLSVFLKQLNQIASGNRKSLPPQHQHPTRLSNMISAIKQAINTNVFVLPYTNIGPMVVFTSFFSTHWYSPRSSGRSLVIFNCMVDLYLYFFCKRRIAISFNLYMTEWDLWPNSPFRVGLYVIPVSFVHDAIVGHSFPVFQRFGEGLRLKQIDNNIVNLRWLRLAGCYVVVDVSRWFLTHA